MTQTQGVAGTLKSYGFLGFLTILFDMGDSSRLHKYSVHLSAEFVHELQVDAMSLSGSPYGAVQMFLRRAVRAETMRYRQQKQAQSGHAAAGAPMWIEVPAVSVRFMEDFLRYWAGAATPVEQEWKRAIEAVVEMYREQEPKRKR